MAIVLGVALVGGIVVRLLKLPVILGYLLSGILIGPHALGLISEKGDVETLAEIGVVLLMFTLGLEFSLRALKRIGKVALLGGGAQIVATAALGLLVGHLLDWSLRESVLFGFFIALSSTIIVLKTLMDRGELGSPHGRVMIGILLVQDISVVPMMVVLPAVDEVGLDLWVSLGWAVLKGVLFLGGIFAIGIWVLPWFMRRVAAGRSRELFLLTVVCLCLGAAFGSYHFGLSAALGAFLAGLLVSGSDYAHQALADIRPLRDIFAILFFVSLGMLVDLSFISENPWEVAAVVVAIVLGKFLITGAVARVFGYSTKTTLFVGSGLFQIGEFSFVLAALALELEIISGDLYSLTLAAALITMLMTPFAMGLTSSLYNRAVQSQRGARLLAGRLDPVELEERKQLINHAVICGYGRVAQNLGTVLERRGFSYLIIDLDPRVIESARERGIPSIYGDASNPDILARAELERAKVLVITFPDPIAARLAAAHARNINSRINMVARVHRDEDTEVLRKLGVAELVRPELEAGLEIIRHTLQRFGLTMQEIQYIINTLREEGV